MNAWLILIAFAFHFMRWGIVFPLVPLLAEKMGAGPSMIGFAVGSFSLIAIFLSIPLGGLVDRFGPKRLLIVGVLCNIINAVILLRTDTVFELICAQMISGVGFLLHVVASQAFFSHMPIPSDRERGFGHLSFSGAGGQSFGPVLGGYLVEQFDYQTAFWIVLALSCAGLSVLGLKGTDERNLQKSPSSLLQNLRPVGLLAANPSILMVLAFTFAIIFATDSRGSFLPVLLRNRGFTEADVGLLLSIFAATSTLIRLFFGKLMDAFDRNKVVAASMLAIIAGVGPIPIIFSKAGYAVILAVLGLGFGLTQPLSMVMMADLADPHLSGLSMGLRFTAIMLGDLLSPIVLGFVVGAFGLAVAFYVAAAVVILSGVHMFVLQSHLLPARRQY
jgi:MFS family permease